MKKELVTRLHSNFEEHAHHEDGVEFWFARELQLLLGYSKCENFEQVIAKAKTACTNSGHNVEDHFPDVRKMVEIGSGTSREIHDIALTRYACYPIAQNGDPRKDEIAFAMTYFAVQTRKQEVIEQQPGTTLKPGVGSLNLQVTAGRYALRLDVELSEQSLLDKVIQAIRLTGGKIDIRAEIVADTATGLRGTTIRIQKDASRVGLTAGYITGPASVNIGLQNAGDTKPVSRGYRNWGTQDRRASSTGSLARSVDCYRS